MKKRIFLIVCQVVILTFLSQAFFAQSTEFTYQGRLLSGSVPANGSHDFEFALWTTEAGGSQIGSTVTLTGVNVNNGVFSVRIDFGNQFPGANRFLEIKVREFGGEAFAVLTPRQAISSAPYSVKSLNSNNAANAANADNLGGVSASKYAFITDPRFSDARNPLPNSPNYIQNTTAPQTGNFNINGNGSVGGFFTGNILNVTSRISIGSTAPTAKFFVAGSGSFNSLGAPRFDLFNTAANAGFTQFVNDFGYWQMISSTGGLRMTVDNTGKVGIGTSTPLERLHVNGRTILSSDTTIGANVFPSATLDVYGTVKFTNFGTAGTIQLCRNSSNFISQCSSSIRYKSNVSDFSAGLNLVKRFRPVSFNWNDGGMRDFGLVAEEVAEIEPLLVTKNEQGETEGVKYDRVGVVLINAINEQQLEIEAQQKQIDEQKEIIRRQQSELDALKKFICSQNPAAEFCQPKN